MSDRLRSMEKTRSDSMFRKADPDHMLSSSTTYVRISGAFRRPTELISWYDIHQLLIIVNRPMHLDNRLGNFCGDFRAICGWRPAPLGNNQRLSVGQAALPTVGCPHSLASRIGAPL